MLKPKLERERPVEWLRSLAEQPEAYNALVEDSGGIASAAYRLASARCRVHGQAGATPTLRELKAAALTIAQQTGELERLPLVAILASDCEAQGQLVIGAATESSSSREPSEPPLRRAS